VTAHAQHGCTSSVEHDHEVLRQQVHIGYSGLPGRYLHRDRAQAVKQILTEKGAAELSRVHRDWSRSESNNPGLARSGPVNLRLRPQYRDLRKIVSAFASRNPMPSGHESLTLGLLFGDQALHKLGPFLPCRPRHLRAAAFHRPGFGWSSLCNRVAQTWGSVPCSTQDQCRRQRPHWLGSHARARDLREVGTHPFVRRGT
jgi:hypothetical protein